MSTADGKKIAIVTGSALGLGYELLWAIFPTNRS